MKNIHRHDYGQFKGELQSKNKLGSIDRVLEEIRNGEGPRAIRLRERRKRIFK